MAFTNIFLPLFGRNVTVTIQPKLVSATGVLSDPANSAIDFVGRFEEVSGFNTETELENVTPADCYLTNEVPVGELSRASITEIMMALPGGRTGALTGNRLAWLVSQYRYFTLTITAKDNTSPTPVARVTEVGLCMWTRYEPSYRRGNAKGRLEIQTVVSFDNSGVYESNPVATIA